MSVSWGMSIQTSFERIASPIEMSNCAIISCYAVVGPGFAFPDPRG